MGKVKNEDDVFQYCMRLNLTNPEHLRLHQMLQNLNPDIHRSKNNFLIQSVLKNIDESGMENILSVEAQQKFAKVQYVTKEELEEAEMRICKKVMKEMVTLLCGSLGRNAAAPVMMPVPQEKSTEENKEDRVPAQVEEDETLSELSSMWS